MKMEPIFEWPEVSHVNAKSLLPYYADVLDRHERGEIDPPLPSKEVTRYRQSWAELNYLVNGRVAIAEANCDCSECVDDEEWDDDESEDDLETESPGASEVVVLPPPEPVYAVADVLHKGTRIAAEGDNLMEVKDGIEREIAYAERRGDRSDAAIMGWTPFIMDARSKLARLSEAIELAS